MTFGSWPLTWRKIEARTLYLFRAFLKRRLGLVTARNNSWKFAESYCKKFSCWNFSLSSSTSLQGHFTWTTFFVRLRRAGGFGKSHGFQGELWGISRGRRSMKGWLEKNYGHFAQWSFCPQSLRSNQKSVRSIIEVTSLHTKVTCY